MPWLGALSDFNSRTQANRSRKVRALMETPTVTDLYVGPHDHLATGTPILHGDEIDADDLAPEDERIRAHLVPIESPQPPGRRTRRARSVSAP